MKLIILLVCLIQLPSSIEKPNDINVFIQFDNNANEEFTRGFITIEGENYLDVVEINSLDDIKISIPKEGKYIFHFGSSHFEGEFIEPNVVFDQSHIIVKIKSPSTESNDILANNQKGLYLIFKERVQFSNLTFIINGVIHQYDERFKNFSDKYGVGFEFKNCSIDPHTYQFSRANNLLIANLLTEKHGEKWSKELPTRPFGVLDYKSQ